MTLFLLIVVGLVAYVAAGSALGKRLKRNASQYPVVQKAPAEPTLDVTLKCGHVLLNLPLIPKGAAAPDSAFCPLCCYNYAVIRIEPSENREF